eukprot:gene9040-10340_t
MNELMVGWMDYVDALYGWINYMDTWMDLLYNSVIFLAMFSLGALLEAALLFVNAVAILQDTTPSLHQGRPPVKRFLARMGWTHVDDDATVKGKIITMVNAVRTLLRCEFNMNPFISFQT